MKAVKILLIILALVVVTGCGKKKTTVVVTSTAKPIPVQTDLFKIAQDNLRNVSSITFNENLLFSYVENDSTVDENIFYETNLSTTKGIMKIDGVNNTENNTVYIVEEDQKYVVYPEEKVNDSHIKYELNDDFILGPGNNKVLNYLMNVEGNYVEMRNSTETVYKRTIELGSLGNDKLMFNDILYHYVNGPLDEALLNVEITEEITVDRNKTFKHIEYDLTNLINQFNPNKEQVQFIYQIDLSNYNDDKVYFPYRNVFALDDAPNTFKNYIYYYSHYIDSVYKELNLNVVTSGQLDFKDDVDIYSVMVPYKALVNIEVNSNTSFTYFVTEHVNDEINYSNQKTQLNHVRELEPGRYYIGVKSDNVGEYTLKVSLNDKFAHLIKREVMMPIEKIDINSTNVVSNNLEYNGDLDVYALSDHKYEVNIPVVEQVQLLLVHQYEDYLEYEIKNDKLYIEQNPAAIQFVLVKSINYSGNYQLEFIKK